MIVITLLRSNIRFLLLLGALLSVGCNKAHPNPEQLDPIYRDLGKDLRTLESSLKAETKTLDSLRKDLKNAPIGSMDKVTIHKNLQKTEEKVADLDQQVRYLQIRTERRRVEGRKAYKIAFQNGEAWPDPMEYEAYKVNKALRNAPRNWGMRVPKLHKADPNFSKVKIPDTSNISGTKEP